MPIHGLGEACRQTGFFIRSEIYDCVEGGICNIKLNSNPHVDQCEQRVAFWKPT
jgi:hypothetical protein